MQYIVKAHGDPDRSLKTQSVLINAYNEKEAWRTAWMMFPEYKELSVHERSDQSDS